MFHFLVAQFYFFMIPLSSSSLLLFGSIPNVFDITSSFCLSSFTGPENFNVFLCGHPSFHFEFGFLHCGIRLPIFLFFFTTSGKRFVPKSRINATKIIIIHSLPIIFSKYSNTKINSFLSKLNICIILNFCSFIGSNHNCPAHHIFLKLNA